MSHKNSGDNTTGKHKMKRRKYGRPSANYHEVAATGLKSPANDNGGMLSDKTKTVLKFVVPIILALAFLAWY